MSKFIRMTYNIAVHLADKITEKMPFRHAFRSSEGPIKDDRHRDRGLWDI